MNGSNDGKMRCWACACYSPTAEENGVYRSILTFIQNNVGKINNVDLAQQLHEYFLAEVVEAHLELAPEEPPPEWPLEMIIEHLEKHTLEPTMRLAVEIKRVATLITQLEGLIGEVNEDGDVCVNVKNANLMLSAQKHLFELYKQDPKGMQFFDDVLAIRKTGYNSFGSDAPKSVLG